MSAIDPGTIDVTQPPAINPTTSGLRAVVTAIKALFVTAKAEVEALQEADAGFSLQIAAAQGDADAAQARADDAHADAATGIANAATAQARADDAHTDAAAIVSAKGQANGYASLNSGSKVVENPANATATPTAGKIVLADALGRVDPWITNRGWHGVLYAAEGDCDPHRMLREWQTSCSVYGPTPTQIGMSIARCVMFVPPRNMTLNRVHLFGVASTSALYKFAIYPTTPGGAKLWDSNTVAGASNTWVTISYGLPVSLVAGTPYWFCVTAAGTGATPGFRSRGAQPGSAFWGPGTYPLGGRGLLFPEYGQFSVSVGTFPGTLPTVGAATSYANLAYGSVPYALLDSAAS